MPQQPRNTLKSYFQTGDRPTQAQFAELIDSFLNKEDENIKVDAGNIGIGLPSNLLPTEKLEVNGNIKATGLIAETLKIGSSTTPNYVLASDADGNATWQDPLQVSNDGDWEIGADTVFNLDDNIGIGVDNPTAKLEVLGDIQASGGDIKISGQKSLLFSSYGGGFKMTDNDWIRTTGGKSFFHETGILRTDGELHVGNNGSRLLVNGNGDVGIGTTTPGQELSVVGTIRAASSSAETDYIQMSATSTNGYISSVGTTRLYLQNAGDTFMTLFKDGTNNNVGIGTSFPSNRLDVAGTIEATRIGVRTSSPASDVHVVGSGGNSWGDYGIRVANSANSIYWNINNSVDAWLTFSRTNVYRIQFRPDGTIWQASDANLKTQILEIGSILDKVKKIIPKSYVFVDKPEYKNIGFLAQEVQQYFPELVSYASSPSPSPSKEKKDVAIKKDETLSICYSQFGVIAIKAIQEQQEIIEGQATEIKALEKKIEALLKQQTSFGDRLKALEGSK